ncbi:MAG: hypothetical protein ACRCTY_00130, partial [Candidatus Adiutrix sp.]
MNHDGDNLSPQEIKPLALSKEQRHKKNRLERGALVLVAVSLVILTLIQREVVDLGPNLSESQGLVTLVSINASVVLMTVLLILILRSLYRVFFEKQGYGSLQTKMVISFICLSMAPTFVIFYYAYRLIVSGHDLWFSPKIEEALSDSLTLTEAALNFDGRLLNFYGNDILDSFEASGLESTINTPALKVFLDYNRRRFHLSVVEFYAGDGRFVATSDESLLPPIYHGWFANQHENPPPWTNIVETQSGDLTRVVWPVMAARGDLAGQGVGFLAVGRLTLT